MVLLTQETHDKMKADLTTAMTEWVLNDLYCDEQSVEYSSVCGSVLRWTRLTLNTLTAEACRVDSKVEVVLNALQHVLPRPRHGREFEDRQRAREFVGDLLDERESLEAEIAVVTAMQMVHRSYAARIMADI